MGTSGHGKPWDENSQRGGQLLAGASGAHGVRPWPSYHPKEGEPEWAKEEGSEPQESSWEHPRLSPMGVGASTLPSVIGTKPGVRQDPLADPPRAAFPGTRSPRAHLPFPPRPLPEEDSSTGTRLLWLPAAPLTCW